MECICGNCRFLISDYKVKNVQYCDNIIKKKAGVILHNPKQNKILIVQSRGNLWGFHKGSFNTGETFEECALRELTEETGIQLTPVVIENSENHNVNENVRYYFVNSCIDYSDVTLQYDKYCVNNDVNGLCWIKLECLRELYFSNKIKLNYHARNCLYKFFKISKKF